MLNIKPDIKADKYSYMEKKLKSNESLANYQYLMDIVWTIYPQNESVEVFKDSINPELDNTKHDYKNLCDTRKKDVYPPDYSLWDEVISFDTFHSMIAEGCMHKKFDIRFFNTHFGFEWHEAFIDIIVNEDGIPDKIILSSRNVNNFRKSQIIEKAVQSEYDYVI